MKAGNAYCQHNGCSQRAREQDRFGNWACSMHLALANKKAQRRVRHLRRWKALAPKPVSAPPARRETFTPSTNPHCPFEPGIFHLKGLP